MTRLKFIFRAVNALAGKRHEPVTEYLLTEAIQREIEIAKQEPRMKLCLWWHDTTSEQEFHEQRWLFTIVTRYTEGERWGAVVSTPTLLSRIAEGLASIEVSWERSPNSNSKCNTLWFFADKVEAGATRCLTW